jgi:hypothetical protein
MRMRRFALLAVIAGYLVAVPAAAGAVVESASAAPAASASR